MGSRLKHQKAAATAAAARPSAACKSLRKHRLAWNTRADSRTARPHGGRRILNVFLDIREDETPPPSTAKESISSLESPQKANKWAHSNVILSYGKFGSLGNVGVIVKHAVCGYVAILVYSSCVGF
jgi:hypothetical protein